MKSFGRLSATISLLLLDVVSAASSPRVIGFDFQRQALTSAQGNKRLARRQSKTVSVALDNAEIAYLINMTVGTPPQMFSVQIDTGSSDIWIPSVASDACRAQDCLAGSYNSGKSTSYSLVDQGTFQISYEDNSGVTGDYINDTVTIGKTSITNMTMGLALSATRGLGIMGIGYDADESITQGGNPDAVYPNIISQLKDQGVVSTLAYSLWLNDLNSDTGSILFGGIDTAKYTGPLTVLPVQKGANNSYTDFTVALSSVSFDDAAGKISYSQNNLALPVILDSGTTATYLPDNIAQDIGRGVGAINNRDYGLIVPCKLASSPSSFTFGFGGDGGPSIKISLSEFVTPIYNDDGSQPKFKDGSGTVCGWGLMSSGEAGAPILLGDTFLRSAYVVYDLTNNQIGLAQTAFNVTQSNVVEISGSEIPSAAATATGAAVTQTYTGHPLEQGHTKTGSGQQATGAVTPTFNLGAAATSKGAAAAGLMPPRVEAMTVVTGLVVLVSVVCGGSLVALL